MQIRCVSHIRPMWSCGRFYTQRQSTLFGGLEKMKLKMNEMEEVRSCHFISRTFVLWHFLWRHLLIPEISPMFGFLASSPLEYGVVVHGGAWDIPDEAVEAHQRGGTLKIMAFLLSFSREISDAHWGLFVQCKKPHRPLSASSKVGHQQLMPPNCVGTVLSIQDASHSLTFWQRCEDHGG